MFEHLALDVFEQREQVPSLVVLLMLVRVARYRWPHSGGWPNPAARHSPLRVLPLNQARRVAAILSPVILWLTRRGDFDARVDCIGTEHTDHGDLDRRRACG